MKINWFSNLELDLNNTIKTLHIISISQMKSSSNRLEEEDHILKEIDWKNSAF